MRIALEIRRKSYENSSLHGAIVPIYTDYQPAYRHHDELFAFVAQLVVERFDVVVLPGLPSSMYNVRTRVVPTIAPDAMDTHHQTALTLIRSERAKRAFRIESEPEKLRERYGRTSLGQCYLLARRLVEEGVRLVSVRSSGWDHHFNLFNDISEKKLPELDRAFSALLEDLNERGLLGTTMVIIGTEFGRTPEINVNAGRDHWPAAFSLVVASGEIEGGRTLGATDHNCWEVTEKPIHVPDFIATIYAKLGIDYHQMYESNVGRPVRVVDEPFEAVKGLLT